MTTLTKDEIIALARESELNKELWLTSQSVERLEKFATLCRADLVAENEKLREVWLEDSVRNSKDRSDLLKERDDLRIENAALLASNKDCLNHYNELRDELAVLRGEK